MENKFSGSFILTEYINLPGETLYLLDENGDIKRMYFNELF